ncbi:MAG: hypothetical protein O7B25_10235 [Gammaproteobacteria bacterium]|nr:hypothetical protein [Gammaproteobacteria bacterium]
MDLLFGEHHTATLDTLPERARIAMKIGAVMAFNHPLSPDFMIEVVWTVEVGGFNSVAGNLDKLRSRMGRMMAILGL